MLPLDTQDEHIVNVVIADGDENRRGRLIDAMGRQARFNVHAVGDFAELAGCLGETRYDVLLVSERFDGIAGLELPDRLRSLTVDLPASVMIGSASVVPVIKAFRCGFADYLTDRTLGDRELRAAIARAAGIARSVRSAAARMDYLEGLTEKDVDTGLPNRQYMHERLERMVRIARREAATFAVIIVHAPEIEPIYAACGVKVGDQALRAFAGRLREVARRHDIFGRFAEDVFLFLVDRHAGPQDIQAICRRIARAADFRLDLDSVTVKLSADIHAIRFPADGTTLAELTASVERSVAPRRRVAGAPAVSVAHEEAGPDIVARDSDRRSDGHRHRVLKRGILILNDGYSTINCIIRDLSQGGARVAVEGQFNAPRFMQLLMVDRNEKVATETRWQRGAAMGLRFVAEEERP